jgi:tuberculosinol/isotuberculosinol synthase
MKLEEFLSLSNEEVADIVRASGTKTCVFPFNGTRRWFVLEHGEKNFQRSAQDYIESTSKAYVNLFRLLFDYGIETVIAPVFGGEILKRGEEYMTQIGASMGLLADHPIFTSFYDRYEIHVHFYGNYRRKFESTRHTSITELFDKVTSSTSSNKKHGLFYGVFADDSAEMLAELSVKYYLANKRIPTKQELIEIYYGEDIGKADLFIGFEKFTVFDYPLLDWGGESLYFTIAPSLYMENILLRKILYDHMFLRPLPEPDYSQMSKDALGLMQNYYMNMREDALGVGYVRDNIWYADINLEK